MKNAILIPGRPDKDEYYDPKQPTNSNNHWFPWLSKQLMQNDIFTVALEIPKPWQPRYDVWKKELERFDITPETILVGHSCGGGFLVRYLSENKELNVDKVVLVAPWTNPDDNPESDTADFFKFEVDPNLVNRTKGLTVFISSDDHPSVVQSVDIIRDKIKDTQFKEFTDKRHFCLKDLGGVEFPELLEAIL
ncbi:MAG TPA: alpha/beta fold hydrolase [Candidatus Saccharimonadales bacterium]|nr:alpha/beta fold hydrolase [Candidatus Saccharimonadales bacterium]